VPTALWPVGGEAVLRRLIGHLSNQGIKYITVCSNGDSSLLAKAVDTGNPPDLELRFKEESLPVGTAGSFRDAVDGENDKLFVVIPASIVNPPDISLLVAAHHDQSADLTVAFNPGSQNDSKRGDVAGIYVCNSSVLEYIPAQGYYDIKESLIPELVQKGKRVCYTVLPHDVGNFRDRHGYLDAIGDYLENAAQADINLKTCDRNDKNVVWKGSGVIVEPGARIYGRVVLLDGVHIESGAVIFGPTILGRNVSIGKDSAVINSIIWDDSRIAENCSIQRCLIDYGVLVPADSALAEQSVVSEPQGGVKRFLGSVSRVVEERGSKKLPKGLPGQRAFLPWLAAGLVSIAFLWCYWSGIKDLWDIWQRSDEYSSGLLVPFLAGYILWSRRKQIAGIRVQPCLWGLLIFIGAQALRFFGLFFMYASAERLSIVLSVVALVLLLLGWSMFRKLSPILLFLFLMLPWPNKVQSALALPLQQWSTSSAVFCLEVVGYEVVREGNVIHIGNATVAVAEACNGLRMITAFFVISGLVVLLVERSWWEKLIVFVSSVPIALFCNTLRLAVTAVAFTMLQGEYWEKMFHDFGGYAMMPLALAIVVGEFWFLNKLTTAPKEDNRILVVKAAR